jgi:hypothetical protein
MPMTTPATIKVVCMSGPVVLPNGKLTDDEERASDARIAPAA